MKMEQGESFDNKEIKSTAVVKYSVPKPAKFMKLQCNTDLNLPPSNWLSNSADSYGLQHVLYQHKEFSSFRMAHMFPDCVGEVDVVSDAENIKNLLKIPYSKGNISMMVHRVENTLLLDDFDIYKHLLKTAENDWEWLRKFFCDTVESNILDEERVLYVKNKKRKALKQKNLVSKFLYHSLVQNDLDISEINHGPLPVQGPLLPEPSQKQGVPDPTSFEHKYNRNVVWTFEDIEMLIGTDMPIFGGGTHPCISLRLHDMNKPINVLTGIDYWLDNLMSNVPEVVMCYHLNGIVQKYELVKTEDLPSMKDSKFAPQLIRDVAQSILSFLKSNATKAGHTYWLFKGKDEEVVKLYDLTSLCTDDPNNSQNPFTIPVAMLLYRVARNMKHSQENKQPGTIRMLLKNCLKLLPEEKYPEIVTSSHYMLADLFIPAETDPDNPKLDHAGDENEFFYDDLETQEDDLTLKILQLNPHKNASKFDDPYKPPPPIGGSIEERCLQAIYHIADGINCLQFFSNEKEKEEKQLEEDNIPMAKPSEPIPMHYASLNEPNKIKQRGKKKEKTKKKENTSGPNALLLKNNAEAQPLPTWQGLPQNNTISWKEHLKTLLYEKAVLVYAILSEHHYISKNYGSSLRCLGLLVRSLQVMRKLKYSICMLKENCLLGRAGDCCMMMVQTWDENYRNQFHTHMDEDLKMLEQIEKDEQLYKIQLSESYMKCVLIYDIRTIEQLLLKAVECYDEAFKLCDSDSILRRLGNSLNEVGSFFLNRAKVAKTEDDILDACKKSEPHLKRSVEIFEKVKDSNNSALLYTNIGHLHRLLAHASTPNERGELTSKEKFHYNKAFFNYKKAMQVLGDRKHSPGIWDAVKWELSTALFTMGTILHENPSSSINIADAEKEVIEMLQKALQYCEFDENNPKFPLYQYRAATIHYRLGSLYHNHIWSSGNNESNKKNIIQLSKLNYEKAAKLFYVSMDAINYLTSQMQRFALTEFLSETTSVPQLKLKHVQTCLDIIIELRDMLLLIKTKKVDICEKDVDEFNAKENNTENFKSCSSLIHLIKQKLQYILRILIKLCLSKPPINKESPKLVLVYKGCYSATFALEKYCDFYGFVSKLIDTLDEIKNKVTADENF